MVISANNAASSNHEPQQCFSSRTVNLNFGGFQPVLLPCDSVRHLCSHLTDKSRSAASKLRNSSNGIRNESVFRGQTWIDFRTVRWQRQQASKRDFCEDMLIEGKSMRCNWCVMGTMSVTFQS